MGPILGRGLVVVAGGWLRHVLVLVFVSIQEVVVARKCMRAHHDQDHNHDNRIGLSKKTSHIV